MQDVGIKMTDDVADDLAIYFHFLYCKSRCPYCDFFKKLLPKSFNEDDLLKHYIEDMERFLPLCGKRNVKSVYFGGGTPSLLSADFVGKVLDELNHRFVINSGAEITLEANPNSFEVEKFKGFNKVGVNRLSLGVQALNDEDLRFLGRLHSADEARLAMDMASKTFDKFSIDLMYTLPEQRDEVWFQEIDEALTYGVKHISLYQLTLEEGTFFYKKNIELPDEETSARLYNDTINYLRKRGFERYEVSNFAVDEYHQSMHNLVYWRGGDYLGIGEGAHGRIKYKDKFIASVDGKIFEELTSHERAEELVIMGLRLKEGISAKRFYEVTKLNLFDFLSKKMTKELAKLNLVVYDDAHIKLTDDGFLVLDEIIFKLLS